MERFVIGHNADPSNWRERIDAFSPQCLELFIPPRYTSPAGLSVLEEAFAALAKHPGAQALEFLSCHFPWGETVDGFSRYHLIDDQYFHSFRTIAQAFNDLRLRLGLPSERSVLNFHNLYEFPRELLKKLKRENKLVSLREILLEHAHAQTLAAKRLLDILGFELTLANENNPPVGAGDRMSVIDVFPADLAARSQSVGVSACFDLSHFFMTKFYYDLTPVERPDFPYLELESEAHPDRLPIFEKFLNMVNPLYYHISDTRWPGTDRTLEGVAIGTGGTPWVDVLTTLGQYAFRYSRKLYLIIELKGGYTAEGIRQCRESEQALRGYIEDCFSSGFLKALEEKDRGS
jgi:hypothetical protein